MDFLTAVIGLFGTLIGAILGAFLGAWAVRRMGRPQPIVLVDALELASSIKLSGAKITINKDIITACDENVFVEATIDDTGTVEEPAYIEYLDNVCEQITVALEHTLPSLRAAALKLRDDLSTDDYKSFVRDWALEMGTIWWFLVSSVIRSDFEFTDAMPDYDDQPIVHALTINSEGEPVIPLVGPRSIIFVWTVAPEHKAEQAKNFAERVANAIAHCNESDINPIINFLLSGRDYDAELKSLLDVVRQEQQRYQRVVVRGQISNSGGSPYSVMPKGKIFISTAGYPYTTGELDNVSNQRTYPHDMELEAVLLSDVREEDDQPKVIDTPISIASGGIQRFTAVTSVHVDDLPDKTVLRSVYGAGERSFRLGLLSITPGRQPLTPLYTASQLFRNWRTQTDIPAPH